MRILIVDDEAEIADSLKKGLGKQGFTADTAYSGEEALEKTSSAAYDLVCLDVSMPGISGFEVCKKIKIQSDGVGEEAPKILMLTALSEIEDRVTGLDGGADDYLVKPFDFLELLARIRALLRRDSNIKNTLIKLGDYELDLKKHTVIANRDTDDPIQLQLTSKEYSLLQFFMFYPGDVFSQEQLLEHNWDENADPLTHTVRVTVSNLRRKLNETNKSLEIETVVGEGYRLVEKIGEER